VLVAGALGCKLRDDHYICVTPELAIQAFATEFPPKF
jgi:hypothetical protein